LTSDEQSREIFSLIYYWVMGGAVKCICEWRSFTFHAIINYYTTWVTRERG